MTSFSKIRFFLITATLIIALGSCNKKNDVIPDVDVDFFIRITDAQFTMLSAFGNSVLISRNTNNIGRLAAGYDNNGIIIFSWVDYEFYAYDRTCPHDYSTSQKSIAIQIDPSNSMNAICPECGTNYSLSTGGMPTEGIGRYPLKNYKTSFDGLNVHVWNKY